ncbi:MAG: ABC-F family ATP-binding cassette domain-containing protein, partial [Bdellovibrionales bacterium]|nr:ABC-F family ATP-binding cassette domain-containing protein [Bdellovibrionales bacterium]
MINVVNCRKWYGARVLFEDLNFSMQRGERLGLAGPNGSGKSTLFRMLLGEETPDDGAIHVPRNYKIGHLAQHLDYSEPSILKEACLGLPVRERDQEYRGEIILSGLGFSEDDMHKPASVFSGGFQIRVSLARLLLSEPHLLLLDEPTNYLDILSVRWLSGFLRAWKNELILISHDRLFMDGVTTHTMVIHRGRSRKLSGGTEKLYQQIKVDEEVYEKTRVNEDKKRKELEAFISRFRAQASKASLVQSKVKALERMGTKDELQDAAALDFKFYAAPFTAKVLGEAQNLSFGYQPEQPLIKNLSFQIRKGDRIGVIGKNGKGKSTLLRLLAGELTPTGGELHFHPAVRIGYFGQTNISRLSPEMTVEQEVGSVNFELGRAAVRSICGTMMFSGDDALKKIKLLSGGERSRVLLGKLLAQPSNLLILDEPTNHLDMQSIEALVESLREYEGTLIIVTHSELILKKLAARLILFQGDFPEVFNHDYQYFL